MAERLTFKNQQEFQNWLAQNPNASGTASSGGQTQEISAPKPQRNFIESLVGSFTDPFTNLASKAGEGLNAFSKNQFNEFLSGDPSYQTKYLSNEQYKNFKENPFLDTAKDVAGVGSMFIPAGALGKGVFGLAKAGALSGGLSSFANQEGNDIDFGKVGTDAALGGLFGGGLGLAGKGVSKLQKGGIGDLFKNAGSAVKSSNLGYKAANFTDDTAMKVASQLDELGLPVTGANAEKVANINTGAFKNSLTNTPAITNFTPDELALEITDTLSKKYGLGKNALETNPSLKAVIQDKVESIMNTGGKPAQMFDEISNLTIPKNIDGQDLALTNQNKVLEATRDVLKNKLQGVVPESAQYFQANAPLRSVIKDSAKAAQSLDNVPIPFGGGVSMKVPGVGLAKQNLTNAFGGGLQNTGKAINGIGDLFARASKSPVSAGNAAKFGGLVAGSGAFNEAPSMDSQIMEPSQSQVQTSQTSNYSPEEQAQIQSALTDLMKPVKQGGMGLSPTEAEKYMKLAYGIDLSSGQAGGKIKKTENQQKFSAAKESALLALDSLNSGKASTGKISAAGNSIAEFFGAQSADQTRYNTLLNAATSAARNALSGAAVSPSEEVRLANLLPNNTDEPATAKAKLKAFAEAMDIYANQ